MLIKYGYYKDKGFDDSGASVPPSRVTGIVAANQWPL